MEQGLHPRAGRSGRAREKPSFRAVFTTGKSWQRSCHMSGRARHGFGDAKKRQDQNLITREDRMAEVKQLSRGELQDLVAKQAIKNPKYRQQLLKDPKSLLA